MKASLSVLQDLRAQGISVYDNSMIKSAIACPRAYQLRHIFGLVLANQTTVPYGLHLGQVGHGALELWAPNKDDNAATLYFADKFAEYEEPAKFSLKTGKELGATYTVLYGCSLLNAYFNKYRSDTREIISLELPLAEEIADGIFMCGRIDKIVKGPRGLVFGDYKFTKYMNDYQVNPNHQFMNYKFLVEKLTGEKVSGELDILGVSKTKDVSELLYRKPVDYTDYQMENWRKSTVEWVNIIEGYKKANFYPQSGNCKPFFRDCEYLPLCTIPVGDVHNNLMKSLYKEDRWDPFMVV